MPQEIWVLTRRNQAMPNAGLEAVRRQVRLAERRVREVEAGVVLGEDLALHVALQLPVAPAAEQRRIAVRQQRARIDVGEAAADHQLLAAPEQVAVDEHHAE